VPENEEALKPQVMVAANGDIQQQKKQRAFKDNFKLFERWLRYKRYVLLKGGNAGAAGNNRKKFFLFNLF